MFKTQESSRRRIGLISSNFSSDEFSNQMHELDKKNKKEAFKEKLGVLQTSYMRENSKIDLEEMKKSYNIELEQTS